MDGIFGGFCGRVGTEPEFETSRTGPWAAFINIAVGDDTEWMRVAVVGEAAKSVNGVVKGDKVYCLGTLWLDEWTDHEGKPRAGLSFSAQKVEKLTEIGRRISPASPTGSSEPADDEIPF